MRPSKNINDIFDYALTKAAYQTGVSVHAWEVRRLERSAEAGMKKEQRKFIGERRIVQQDPYDSPTSWERRRGLNPTTPSTARSTLPDNTSATARTWYGSSALVLAGPGPR